MLKNQETRNTLFYLLGVLLLLGLLFFVVIRFSEQGFGVLNTSPEKTYSAVPEKVIIDGRDYQAIFKTNVGDVRVDLFEVNAPTTVNNFVFLSRDDYYDTTSIHRVVKDFIIQGGSRLTLDDNPNNDGLGGPGYRFADETNWASINLDQSAQESLTAQGFTSSPNVTSQPMEKYSLAMANAGPNTNGSQFFFVTGETDSDNVVALRGKHTVFGKVISGQEVINSINNAELRNTNTNSPSPVNQIVINDIEITEN